MRAKEFVFEVKKPKLSNHHQASTRGLHKFTDSPFDRLYMLNRVMMAVASTDGKNKPNVPAESYFGKSNSSYPYTKEESDMLNLAYDAVGIPRILDVNNGNLESEEVSSTNKQSPVKPFKGYKK